MLLGTCKNIIPYVRLSRPKLYSTMPNLKSVTAAPALTIRHTPTHCNCEPSFVGGRLAFLTIVSIRNAM